MRFGVTLATGLTWVVGGENPSRLPVSREDVWAVTDRDGLAVVFNRSGRGLHVWDQATALNIAESLIPEEADQLPRATLVPNPDTPGLSSSMPRRYA